MAIETLGQVPFSMTAGDTVKFTKSFADFPVADWTLTYAFLGGNQSSKFEVAATVSGDEFLTTLTPELTEKVFPGTYNYAGFVTGTDGQRKTVDSGRIQIAPNLAITQPETWAQQALAMVEAALLKRIPKGMENFSINGKSVNRMAIAELNKLRDIYKNEVVLEQKATGLGRSRNHGIRFICP